MICRRLRVRQVLSVQHLKNVPFPSGFCGYWWEIHCHWHFSLISEMFLSRFFQDLFLFLFLLFFFLQNMIREVCSVFFFCICRFMSFVKFGEIPAITSVFHFFSSHTVFQIFCYTAFKSLRFCSFLQVIFPLLFRLGSFFSFAQTLSHWFFPLSSPFYCWVHYWVFNFITFSSSKFSI